jgi:hypothetical protein
MPSTFGGVLMILKTVATALVLVYAQVAWAQTSTAARPVPPDDESGIADRSLAGTWKAKTERLPLSGDFNEKVWGKNAVSVRDVTLVVKPNATATLTIARKVLDGRGRVAPGTPSVEEASITIGEAKPGFATRLDHDVKVVKAERRYPDDPDDRWPLENLVVHVVSFSDSSNTLEVRFEPADGQGSFSEILSRGVTRTAARN